VTDIRHCEQCGDEFEPRREHARFCSARCRVAWNRANTGDRGAEVNALSWSISAMRDTTERLSRVRASDRARAFAVIGEAVWWVTIVDATLVRHIPDPYDEVLAGQPPAGRQLIEGTLGGLRFVRNRMGHEFDHVDFICPHPNAPSPDAEPITAWTWKQVREPELASFSPRGQTWELTRYHAYQTQLAGHPIGEVFSRAAAFLELAASAADGDANAAAGQASPMRR
jgi:hypothetical protein